jgi:hypothetical protein
MNDIFEIDGKDHIWRGLLRKRIGCGTHTLANWVYRGLLPEPIRLGNRLYFRLDKVEELLSKGE